MRIINARSGIRNDNIFLNIERQNFDNCHLGEEEIIKIYIPKKSTVIKETNF